MYGLSPLYLKLVLIHLSPKLETTCFLSLQDTFKVHYENNSPFLTITSMTRVIEVSHWGNIAVEENVDLKHTGAVLKGPFSRYDYQRQPDSGIASIRSFKVRGVQRGHWEKLLFYYICPLAFWKYLNMDHCLGSIGVQVVQFAGLEPTERILKIKNAPICINRAIFSFKKRFYF